MRLPGAQGVAIIHSKLVLKLRVIRKVCIMVPDIAKETAESVGGALSLCSKLWVGKLAESGRLGVNGVEQGLGPVEVV
jgi:hypothetical protein